MTRFLTATCAFAMLLAFAPMAQAATPGEKCRATIIKEAGKYVQAVTKTLGKCNESLLKDKPGFGPAGAACDDVDTKTSEKLTKATTKFRAKVTKACGGGDQICNGLGTPGKPEVGLAAIGWDIGTCQNFEKGACLNAIVDCDDVSTCLLCVNDAAVDQAMELYYATLDQGVDPGSALGKCQKTIGKETAKFLLAKSKILAKCWAAIDKGKAGFSVPCPSGDSSGKTLEKIAKAESKKVAKLCKACGGVDGQCDDAVTAPSGTVFPGSANADDLSPGAIGFAATCPAVTVPGGPSCGGPVTTLADLVQCVDCVTEFKVDCMDESTVPHHVSLDPDCNLGCGNGVLDPGEDCETAADCAPTENCNAVCACLATSPLGERTLSASATSAFFNGFIPGTPLAVPAGSLVLDGGIPNGVTGMAPVTLGPGAPYFITTDITLGSTTVCAEIQSCTGTVDCDGGSNVDGEHERDSLDPNEPSCVQDGTNSCPNLPSSVCCSNACEGVGVGSGNPEVPATGINATDSGAGAISLLCSMRVKETALGTDCSTVDYSTEPVESRVLTTGSVTARVINHCAGVGAPANAVVELTKTGTNFDCADWTTENGPGALAYAIATEEPTAAISGDSTTAVVLDD